MDYSVVHSQDDSIHHIYQLVYILCLHVVQYVSLCVKELFIVIKFVFCL